MPMIEAMSRSDALTAIPSSRTRQASLTTGRKTISATSLSDNFINCGLTNQHGDHNKSQIKHDIIVKKKQSILDWY